MNAPPPNSSSSDAAAALLGTVARLRQSGDIARARALLRMLATQYPDDLRVWRALADVAEHEDERLTAVRRLAELTPPAATIPAGESAAPPKTIAAYEPAAVAPPPVTPVEQIAPAQRTERLARRYNWVGFAIVGVALLLVVALLFSTNRFSIMAARQTPTPPLPGAEITSDAPTPPAEATSAPPAATAASPAETTAEATSAPEAPSPTIPPTATIPAPTATPAPTIPPRPTLAAGEVVTRDTWTYAILRPDHVVELTGAIGSLQPTGRFVMALVAVGNDGDSPSVAPADVFMLTDSHGNRYSPVTGASTTYLNTYGRGSHGDLSLEEAVPAGIGNVSIPVIFDVPADAQGLMFFIGDSPAGWPVTGAP